MKRRKLYTILCIILSIFALQIFTACETSKRKINNSYVKFFHFVTEDNTFLFDYQLDGYFSSDKLQKKIDELNDEDHQVDEIKYLDGTKFSVLTDDINEYFVNHEPDTIVNDRVFVSKEDYPAYTVVVKMKLTEYKITWKGVDNSEFIAPTFYNVDMIGTPLPIPSKDDMVFKQWYIEDEEGNHIIKTTYEKLGDVTYIAEWEAKQIKIIYQDDNKEHNNETNILLQNGIYNLKPIVDNPGYIFHGWKLNNEYVTELDPMKLWIEGKGTIQEIVLVADLEYIKHTFNFYNEDQSLLKSFDCTYEEWQNFTYPDVPTKEHYVGTWDKSLDEFKNYDIYPKYELEKYHITFNTNIDGYVIDDKECSYGTTYNDIISQLSFGDKYLIGVYLDQEMTIEVDNNNIIDKDCTLYIKLSNKYIISTKEDWKLITEHPDGYFELANDINFGAESLPTITEFNGIIDGKEFTVSNFVNSNVNCTKSYGIFTNNSGTISNINFSKFTYTISNKPTDGTINLGFLTGYNYGDISNIKIIEATITIITYHSSNGGEINCHMYAGVLAGSNYGNIDNCNISATVTMTSKIDLKSNRQPNIIARFIASYGVVVGGNFGLISQCSVSDIDYRFHDTFELNESLTADNPFYYNEVHYALQTGGIAGYNSSDGNITYCIYVAGEIYSEFNIQRKNYFEGIVDGGGIVGTNAGIVDHCVTDTDITSWANAEFRLGGIAGTNETSGFIRAIQVYVQLEAYRYENSYIPDSYFGGVVGINSGIMTYCSILPCDLYAPSLTGDNNHFGLLFGKADNASTITNCFVNTDMAFIHGINGENYKIYISGLIEEAVISNCFIYIANVVLSEFVYNFESGISIMYYKEEIPMIYDYLDFDSMGFYLKTTSSFDYYSILLLFFLEEQ